MKDRLFLDTNIILDLLGERLPYYHSTARLASLADHKQIVLVASTLSLATVHYILKKYEGDSIAREKLAKFCILCELVDLKAETIAKGLNSPFSDFEDVLQYYSAIVAKCKLIITRNATDYKQSDLPVMSVDEYLQMKN